MQEYIDNNTQGDQLEVYFYDGSSDHTYSIANTYKWNQTNGDFFKDVKAMCKQLAYRGLPAVDLILGSETADAILKLQEVRDLLDKNSGIIVGQINQELTQYDGVAFMGVLNFGGYRLNLFDVSESYTDDSNQDTPYFPSKGAMVTAPGCGHMMYGAVTQIDFGSTEFRTHAKSRVPKFILDQENDIRKLRLTCRPLAAPKNYCPYIYAANAIN